MSERVPRSARVAVIDQIMRQVGWHVQKRSTQTLSRPELDLTLPQMVTLFTIHDHQSCRMSDLAELTQQSAGTLTGIVDRLIDDGLVARIRNHEDRRVVEVTLTELGEQRINQVVLARQADMAQILQQFGDDELAMLEYLLQKLFVGIHQQESDSDGDILEREVEA